jgi:hypothetical protein
MLTKAEYWETQFVNLIDTLDVWLDNADAVHHSFKQGVEEWASELELLKSVGSVDIPRILHGYEQASKHKAGEQTMEVVIRGIAELLANAEYKAYEEVDLEGNDEFGL